MQLLGPFRGPRQDPHRTPMPPLKLALLCKPVLLRNLALLRNLEHLPRPYSLRSPMSPPNLRMLALLHKLDPLHNLEHLPRPYSLRSPMSPPNLRLLALYLLTGLFLALVNPFSAASLRTEPSPGVLNFLLGILLALVKLFSTTLFPQPLPRIPFLPRRLELPRPRNPLDRLHPLMPLERRLLSLKRPHRPEIYFSSGRIFLLQDCIHRPDRCFSSGWIFLFQI